MNHDGIKQFMISIIHRARTMYCIDMGEAEAYHWKSELGGYFVKTLKVKNLKLYRMPLV
jgi:hypothetical protein